MKYRTFGFAATVRIYFVIYIVQYLTLFVVLNTFELMYYLYEYSHLHLRVKNRHTKGKRPSSIHFVILLFFKTIKF